MTGELNRICTDCEHLGKACKGTKNKVWSGCIIKDADEKTAAEYINHMTSILKGEARTDDITL